MTERRIAPTTTAPGPRHERRCGPGAAENGPRDSRRPPPEPGGGLVAIDTSAQTSLHRER